MQQQEQQWDKWNPPLGTSPPPEQANSSVQGLMEMVFNAVMLAMVAFLLYFFFKQELQSNDDRGGGGRNNNNRHYNNNGPGISQDMIRFQPAYTDSSIPPGAGMVLDLPSPANASVVFPPPLGNGWAQVDVRDHRNRRFVTYTTHYPSLTVQSSTRGLLPGSPPIDCGPPQPQSPPPPPEEFDFRPPRPPPPSTSSPPSGSGSFHDAMMTQPRLTPTRQMNPWDTPYQVRSRQLQQQRQQEGSLNRNDPSFWH